MIGIKKILVATDFGPASDTALRYGRELARGFHASLDVLHITENVYAMAATGYEFMSLPVGVQEDIERAAAQETERLLTDADRRELRAKGVTKTDTIPASAIVTYAREAKADLIILGTHGRGALGHLFLGSVAERVVRLAPCPVLTVHSPEREFVVSDARMSMAKV